MKKRLAVLLLLICIGICCTVMADEDVFEVQVNTEQAFRDALLDTAESAGKKKTIVMTGDIIFTSDIEINCNVAIYMNQYKINGTNDAVMYFGSGTEVTVYTNYRTADAEPGIHMPVVNRGVLFGRGVFYDSFTNDGTVSGNSTFYGTFSGGENGSVVKLRLNAAPYVFTEAPEGWELDLSNKSIITKQVVRGQKITEALPVPDRTGWKMDGWYYSENSMYYSMGELFDSSKPVHEGDLGDFVPNGAPKRPYINLTAKWSLKDGYALYRLEFDANGAIKIGNGMAPIEITLGETVKLPDWNGFDSSSVGCFLGYNTKQDGTGKAYAVGDLFTYDGTVSILYAQWQPKSMETTESIYNVYYHKNDGTDDSVAFGPYSASESPHATKTLEELKFTAPQNKRFVGWSFSSDGSAQFKPGEKITFYTTSVDLYAIWEDLPAMSIDEHPQSTTVWEGETATFSIKATGEDLNYAWYVDRNDGKGFVPCENATKSVYTVVGRMNRNGYRYFCRVSNKTESVDSNVATLNVKEANNTSNTNNNIIAPPQTGDAAKLAPWLLLALAFCIGAVAYLRGKRKNA